MIRIGSFTVSRNTSTRVACFNTANLPPASLLWGIDMRARRVMDIRRRAADVGLLPAAESGRVAAATLPRISSMRSTAGATACDSMLSVFGNNGSKNKMNAPPMTRPTTRRLRMSF